MAHSSLSIPLGPTFTVCATAIHAWPRCIYIYPNQTIVPDRVRTTIRVHLQPPMLTKSATPVRSSPLGIKQQMTGCNQPPRTLINCPAPLSTAPYPSLPPAHLAAAPHPRTLPRAEVVRIGGAFSLIWRIRPLYHRLLAFFFIPMHPSNFHVQNTHPVPFLLSPGS